MKKSKRKVLKDRDVVYLRNPWTGSLKPVPWRYVKMWAQSRVHKINRDDWLAVAERAAKAQDWATLGAMIIGA